MMNFKIDFMIQEIRMTKNFYKRAQNYGTAECDTLCRLTREFPSFRLVINESPRYVNKTMYPTFEKMRQWIILNVPDVEDALDEFHKAIQMAHCTTNVYNHVRKWFFLNYGEAYKTSIELNCCYRDENCYAVAV